MREGGDLIDGFDEEGHVLPEAQERSPNIKYEISSKDEGDEEDERPEELKGIEKWRNDVDADEGKLREYDDKMDFQQRALDAMGTDAYINHEKTYKVTTPLPPPLFLLFILVANFLITVWN